MPYENDSVSTEEFAQLLSVFNDLCITYSDYNVVIGGDFNVDFSRDWVYTALLDSLCDNIGLTPIARHPKCNIDYSYNFNMSRFSILDQFLLSGFLFNYCVVEASVLHSVDNTSDNDPIDLLDLDVNFVGLSQRNITPQVSWARAANSDLEAYSRNLSCLLSDISIPVDAVLCCNLSCNSL